jgi:DNA polymerase
MDHLTAQRLTRQDALALSLIGVDSIRRRSTPAGPASIATRAPVSAEQASRHALLDAVRDRYTADEPHRDFDTDHTTVVFGEGDPCARLMFVGEAPGAEEDRLGRPFVGPAGQLLDKMIVAMGLTRDAVYIANVLKVRPRNNATPTPHEAQRSAPYLHEQIRIVRPEVIITLGLPATHLLLGVSDAMRDLRGRFASFTPSLSVLGEPEPAAAIPVMPTYHPAFLLRSPTPENRGKVWSDLKAVMARLADSSAG